jgi:transposase, IS5 family
VDKGYRGYNHPNRFQVWISGQVRRTTAALRREMKRRAAIKPVIGHLKAEHRMGRNHLKGREAFASTPSWRRWLAALLWVFVLMLVGYGPLPNVRDSNRQTFFTDD